MQPDDRDSGARLALCTGNAMVARAALAAGCNFFVGYPITPSSEIYAEMMKRLPGEGGVALGAPDEISAISNAIGASLAGARAMTATSGPGWSLMVESFQYALMSETPLVIALVQRLGPATGAATQGAQGDVLFVRYANSGAYPFPVLCPVDAVDCYALTAQAFALSEQLRSPVVLLSDKEVATTVETVDLAGLPEVAVQGRRLFDGEAAAFVPYGIDAPRDVPSFAAVGGRCKVTVTGSAHNELGQLRRNDPRVLRQLEHLTAKVDQRALELERVRWRRQDGARTLLVSYGISARACRSAVAELAGLGVAVDLLEVLSLFPVPARALRRAAALVERVVIVEENAHGLYASQIDSLLDGREVRRVNGVGRLIAPAAIREAIA